ncbi:hypothetical protein QN277_011055 [Acacia crassicarpa]|uniref:Endonuclease/exonuclease/phosphatase domain-containing protein n=1 Tax=Acacia crassicarpa TaxID=499986 RepID=A0AAE1IPM7_9FABA|nr:hypothetical protein QN277_011055 [Acacia crassicarpa]
MNYLIWNSRGTGARSFPALICDLKAHYQLEFIAILETRCTKEMSVGRASQFGFPNMELIDCVGYSEGIWCLWEHNIAAISVIEQHHQFITFQITGAAGNVWFLTVVYVRRILWEELSRFAISIQGPWLIGGDFNGTLLHCERHLLAPFHRSVDRDFVSWIDSHDIRDVGFVGPVFTWKRGNTEARFDRMLANNQWFDLFPNASVAHLPFFKSDHRPLLLQLDSARTSPKPNRPFRFIAAWVLHDRFDEFVRGSWDTKVP